MNYLIEPEGVEVLYYTTSSCGHEWASKLKGIGVTMSLAELSSLGTGSEVFANLAAYAQRHGLEVLSRMDVLRYFVTEHINDANRSAAFKSESQNPANRFVGLLLANCVLWPLEEDRSLSLEGVQVKVSGTEEMGGTGALFLHRKALFRVPVSAEERSELKGLLAENELFLAALQCVGERLNLPIVPAKNK